MASRTRWTTRGTRRARVSRALQTASMIPFDTFTAAVRDHAPRLAVVLGSGLGAVPRSFEELAAVRFADVPGLVAPSVHGHGGAIAIGLCAGQPLLVFRGRLHYYEGHPWNQVAAPVRLAAELGIQFLLLTNAAGGIRDDLWPGDLMVLRDHLFLQRPNAWREPAGTPPYSARLNEQLQSIDRELAAGVYAAVTGPCYEAAAEIRALKAMGADAVGMSTAFEAMTAAGLGLEVVAISCVTNKAAGLTAGTLDHRDVLANAARPAERISAIVTEFINRLQSISGRLRSRRTIGRYTVPRVQTHAAPSCRPPPGAAGRVPRRRRGAEGRVRGREAPQPGLQLGQGRGPGPPQTGRVRPQRSQGRTGHDVRPRRGVAVREQGPVRLSRRYVREAGHRDGRHQLPALERQGRGQAPGPHPRRGQGVRLGEGERPQIRRLPGQAVRQRPLDGRAPGRPAGDRRGVPEGREVLIEGRPRGDGRERCLHDRPESRGDPRRVRHGRGRVQGGVAAGARENQRAAVLDRVRDQRLPDS